MVYIQHKYYLQHRDYGFLHT